MTTNTIATVTLAPFPKTPKTPLSITKIAFPDRESAFAFADAAGRSTEVYVQKVSLGPSDGGPLAGWEQKTARIYPHRAILPNGCVCAMCGKAPEYFGGGSREGIFNVFRHTRLPENHHCSEACARESATTLGVEVLS